MAQMDTYLLFLLCLTSIVSMSFSVNSKSDNKIDCVNQLVDWCNGMNYPNKTTAIGSISTTISDIDEAGEVKKLSCKSDYRGTKCKENHSPWFSCSPHNKLTYHGAKLRKNSVAGADDEICDTVTKAFDVLSLQTMSFGNTSGSLNEGMKQVRAGIKALREGLQALDYSGFQDCFPFCDVGR